MTTQPFCFAGCADSTVNYHCLHRRALPWLKAGAAVLVTNGEKQMEKVQRRLQRRLPAKKPAGKPQPASSGQEPPVMERQAAVSRSHL